MSKFRYEPYGYIITGDLNILEDRKVKNFLYEKGLNIVLLQKLTGMSGVALSFMTLFLLIAKRQKKSLGVFLNKCKYTVNIRIAHLENNLENTNKVSSISRIKAKLQSRQQFGRGMS